MTKRCKLSDLRVNIHKLSALIINIHITSANNNNTLNPGRVEFLEVEDKEEDLVVEEAKLYVIIVGILDIFPGIARVLL